ncbi:nuclear transport factor 2 family protein [Halobacillus kuroshimensis]|uniref:nuclear transport factor 2 family protein n=1 Tax=Halobacillus kuroshimensis TaxID=302481 RepID=UPI0004283ABF|nr:nuclear transport factor 2 family protein [Halobacillus kuroshimensis]
MKNLDLYFDLFDRSRTSEQAEEELHQLFSEDMVFVLNGDRNEGIDNWKSFVRSIYENNVDLKHMYEGWRKHEGTDLYVTKWAVCGKLASGKVYTQTGIDKAMLNENGEITYLENIPDQQDLFASY